MGLCASNNFVQNFDARTNSTREVGGVFNLDQSRCRAERAIRRNRRLDVLPCQNPALGRHGADQAAGEHRRRRHLIIENVCARLGDHFLARLRQRANRNLVAHCARGHKQRRHAAKPLRRAPLQQIDRGVFAINVVADFGRSHRRAHLKRRLGYGVGSQINDSCQFPSAFPLSCSLVPFPYGISFIGSSITGVRFPSFSA